MTMTTDFSRIDRIVTEMERLRTEANEIIDSYVDWVVRTRPRGTSWGVTKLNEVAKPAGSTIDHSEALKLVRDKLKG
jgi:hypothetical protein